MFIAMNEPQKDLAPVGAKPHQSKTDELQTVALLELKTQKGMVRL